MSDQDAARAALREKQGAGARYDADAAPHADLLLARRGTAFFARKLNELGDDDLWGASARPGWTRRHLIAHVAYHARALAHVVEGVRTGAPVPMYPSAAARDGDIARGATLPARALRHLFDHAVKHLDVEWRDLPDAGWGASVTLIEGTTAPVCDLPQWRAGELWQGALDLANGARASDLPVAVRSAPRVAST